VHWGIEGVAVAYSCAWMLLMIPGFSIPFRLIKLSWREFLAPMLPVLAIAGIMTACALLWRFLLSQAGVQQPAIHLFTTIAVACAVYAGLLLAWKPAALLEMAIVLEGHGSFVLTRLLKRGR
jgi:hypothetical protein